LGKSFILGSKKKKSVEMLGESSRPFQPDSFFFSFLKAKKPTKILLLNSFLGNQEAKKNLIQRNLITKDRLCGYMTFSKPNLNFFNLI